MTTHRTTSDNPDFQELSDELEQDLQLRDGEQHLFYAALNKAGRLPNVIVACKNEQSVAYGAVRMYTEDTMEINACL